MLTCPTLQSSKSPDHLERQFQAQLNVAGHIRLACDDTEIRSIDGRARSTEYRSIRQVKGFGSERKSEALRDVEVLEQRHIQIPGLIRSNASVCSCQIAGGEVRRLRK